jgi:hypothetical protein
MRKFAYQETSYTNETLYANIGTYAQDESALAEV